MNGDDQAPSQTVTLAVPSKDDIDYAEYFVDVATAIDAAAHSESVALRLSTCRNLYLTVNAIFVDVRLILGHGRNPSELSSAIETARRSDYVRSNTLIDRVRSVLSQIDDKVKCWNDREMLDAEFASAVAELDVIARDRIHYLLHHCRTTNSRTGQVWDPKYYELSKAQPADALELMTSLARVTDRVRAVASVLRCVTALQQRWREGEQLYGPDCASLWHDLASCIRHNALVLGGAIEDDACHLQPADADEPVVTVSSQIPHDAKVVVQHVIASMSIIEREQYGNLVRSFSSNESPPPLPPPFVVDLREKQLSESRSKQSEVPRLRYYDVGTRVPSSTRVAVPQFGIPVAWYNERDFRFIADKEREEVVRLANASLDAATRAGASAIVFPEFFLPRFAIDDLAMRARDAGMILVAGLEGMLASGMLVNSLAIEIPGHPRIEQVKQGPSGYETADFHRSPVLHVVERSSLGTFAALACSDVLEWPLISALADARTLIDVLIVCSCNPYPELYEQVARADASRLYCGVVIANNCPNEGDGSTASARGTGLWLPTRHATNEMAEDVDVITAPVCGEPPRLRVLTVPLGEVRRNRLKPATGFLPVPRCRQPVRTSLGNAV